jgi:hypothetical protein
MEKPDGNCEILPFKVIGKSYFKKKDLDKTIYDFSEKPRETLWTKLERDWKALERKHAIRDRLVALVRKYESQKQESPNSATPRKYRGYDDFKDMDIDAFIAHLTELKDSCQTDYLQVKEREEKRIAMYTCLRDQYSAKTVADAVDKFRLGQLPEKTVEFWVAEGYIGQWEYDAIKQAYPGIKLPDVLNDKEFNEMMAELFGTLMTLELQIEKEDEERDPNGFDTSGYDGWIKPE